ncbi:MAG: sodium-dependent dicarboxylate transporter 2/3/5, partial [Kiritimatiellia bacterium]
PFVLLAIPAAWWVITRVAFPLPRSFARPPQPPKTSTWSLAEVGVVAVISVAMIGWFTRKPIAITTDLAVFGWGQLLPTGWSHDAMVAIAAALLLFLLPALPKSRRPEHMGRVLLTAKRLDKAVPWSVLILLGGGFSLAEGIKQSQLTQWLAKGTTTLGQLQHAFGDGTIGTWLGTGAVILVVCLIMTFLTELTSNTATTRIVLPVLAAGAVATGVDPVLWMVPATISASCAFMMPVATAPNAIASQAGDVAPGDMAWAGLILNLVCVVIAAGVSMVMVPLVLDSWP